MQWSKEHAITHHKLTRGVNHHTDCRDNPVYIRPWRPSKHEDPNRGCDTGKYSRNEPSLWKADAILHRAGLVYEPDEAAIDNGAEETGYHESDESNSRYAQRESIDALINQGKRLEV